MRRIFSVAAVALMLLACGGSAAPVRVQVQVNRVVEESVIEAEFVARSTPGNAQFRKHLTEEQLTKLVRGRPESIAATADYLRRIGATHVSTFRTEDYVTATVEQGSAAAKALGIAEAAFAGSKRAAVPVPRELQAHAQRVLVVPSKRPAKKTKKIHAAESASGASASGSAVTGFPGATQTPYTIRQRYDVPSTLLDPSNVQGVAEFQSSYFSLEWISTFANAFNISNNELNLNVKGPNAVSSDDQEGVLDLEYIIGLAPGATTWWISSNDTSTVSPANIDFAWWCDEVLGLKPRPSVTSISWGLGETEYDTAVDLMYSDNDAFRKLGLVGVSVMVASGDSGPGSRRDITCSRFNPSWPASSPYVTAVGANYAEANGTEAAIFFSGGGFSDFFARPAYQSKAVEQYFTTAKASLPSASFYNASGRGFPDVSTVGTNFRVYGDNGEGTIGWTWLSGTSCASPTFAAIITRVNAERAKAGKSSLGFLNPALYQLGNIGTDIVVGANQDQDCFGFDFGGFTTAPGWDPVSGLGSPKYPTLLKGL